uniref:Uncharacterized protein n=1 Tax=Odontella aurita TaxID=265563 RepID=A0A7S4JU34_9STRA
MLGLEFDRAPLMAPSSVLVLAVAFAFLGVVPCSAECERDLKECISTSTFVQRDPSLGCAFPPCPQADPYLLYVWREGYHPENAHTSGISSALCGTALHANPASGSSAQPECWEHNWEGWMARANLWAATTRVSRTVGLTLVGSVRSRLEDLHDAGWPRNAAGRCDDELYWLLRTNHCHGTRVYALFADSDSDFSERDRIPLVGWYNGNCSDGAAANIFDGVAVNNEHFSSVRCDYQEGLGSGELTWLDQLYDATQLADPLPLHLSVGWFWSRCTNSTDGSYYANEIPWSPLYAGPNMTKPALQHMYDIVSSVDVQVAHTNPSSVLDRIDWADYSYHESNHSVREMYTLAYTNPPPGTLPTETTVCAYSHYYVYPPGSSLCGTPSGEIGMFATFEAVELDRPHARGGMHSMHKSYGTGIRPDWPLIPFSSSFAYIRCILSAITLVDVEKKILEKAGDDSDGFGTGNIGKMKVFLKRANNGIAAAERMTLKLRDHHQPGTASPPRYADALDSINHASSARHNRYRTSIKNRSPENSAGRDTQIPRQACLLLRSTLRDIRSLWKIMSRLSAQDSPAISETLHIKRGVPRLVESVCSTGW